VTIDTVGVVNVRFKPVEITHGTIQQFTLHGYRFKGYWLKDSFIWSFAVSAGRKDEQEGNGYQREDYFFHTACV
jgi:hypothetical protein